MPDFDFASVDVCIYHKNCADGFCSAYLVWNCIGGKGARDINFISLNPSHKVDQNFLTTLVGKTVLVVDLSFSREDLIKIKEVAKQILVIDHHDSAEKDLSGLDFAVFDSKRCGATLFWRHYVKWINKLTPDVGIDPEIAPLIARFVQERDLWTFAIPDSKAVTSYINTMPYDFNKWCELDYLLNNQETLKGIVFEGNVIYNTQLRMVNELADYAREVVFYMSPSKHNQVKARVINCPVRELISETGDTILTRESKKPVEERVDIAVMYTLFSDGGILYSIRSIAPFDASVIAVAWGGGGHKQACGFRGDMKDGFPWVLVNKSNA